MNESEIPPPIPGPPKLPKLEQDTVPVPDAAQVVIEALAPKLDAILTEIGLIKLHVGHLDDEIVELRASRITSDAKINAIDNGVRGLMSNMNTLDATVSHFRAAQRDLIDAVVDHTQRLETLDAKLDDRHDHVMARVVSLEDFRKVTERVEDGSLVSAVALEGGE